MLVFQIGDERGTVPDFRGMPVSVPDWSRQRRTRLANLLREAGFELLEQPLSGSRSREPVAQGYVLARKRRP